MPAAAANLSATAPLSLPQQHNAVSSWFIGPKAENYNYLSYFINSILQHHRYVREEYFKDDKVFITTEAQNSGRFQENMQALSDRLGVLSEHLGRFSVPFWSPRYNGHMVSDLSMPAILGYFATMLYNQNNVSFDGGPLTTQLELQAGQDLCGMLGYYVPVEKNSKQYPSLPRYAKLPLRSGADPIAFLPVKQEAGEDPLPVGWGHITCDGSVANLESIWAARNLKLYPIALLDAMKSELAFVSATFTVETCNGKRKLFKDLSSWELLNLKVRTVLGIPEALYSQYNISPTWLDGVMKKYTVQSVGLAESLSNTKPIVYLGSITKHYSWPKGCAISGIGSHNWRDINVDRSGRLNVSHLRSVLEDCLAKKQAVYAVVAIMGSTQEGAVDPLEDILNLRAQMQKKGLSFVVHCDAAWGGYFTSVLQREKLFDKKILKDHDIRDVVPTLPLKPYTIRQLLRIAHADSVTTDPHKSGYVPFPAGALCYRDERMRYLVTWSSPVIDRDNTAESIGVYAVEGSKPGAAAVATWLSNKFIGLKPTGYGRLLGEAIFTCSRMAAQWAALQSDPDDFVVIPFNMLPGDDPKSPETPTNQDPILEKLRYFIRTEILPKTNQEIQGNPKAMELLRHLGSDLNINTFACNFRLSPGGQVNDDLEEANYFNSQIIKALSVDTKNAEVKDIPLFLMGTTLLQKSYQDCLDTFKLRLGLSDSGDLTVLSNAVLSPFTTENGFIETLIESFKSVVTKQVKVSRRRNIATPDIHRFIIQGTGLNDQLYLVHLPMFHMESHRKQLIITAKVPKHTIETYRKVRAANPDTVYVLANLDPAPLQDLLKDSWTGSIAQFSDCEILPLPPVVDGFEVNGINIVKQRGLRYRFREADYPHVMPFYLYGTTKEMHMDHMLLHAPNVVVAMESIELTKLSSPLPEDELANGMILFVDSVYEKTMQPLRGNQIRNLLSPGNSYSVTIYKDFKPPTADGPGLLPDISVALPIATGKLVVKQGQCRIFCEFNNLNKDGPVALGMDKGAWKKEVTDFVQFEGSYSQSYPLPWELRSGDLMGALNTLEKERSGVVAEQNMDSKKLGLRKYANSRKLGLRKLKGLRKSIHKLIDSRLSSLSNMNSE